MKIAHTGDIHIFLNKRHEEHKQVFQNFYKSLKENKVDRIAVLGDIVNNKINLSPEVIEITSNFFIELSKIAPVDIIIGNHDTIERNSDRLDSITPIVQASRKSFEHKVEIYKESNLYDIGNNIVYGVFSILDKKNFPIEFKREKNKTYIALFHGAISGVKLNDNFILDNTGYSKDLFKNYDITLCADIHIPQSIENCYYPGSFLCIDFSEGNRKHGYLLWDTDTLTNKFIEIQNDYGFYDLKSTVKYTKDYLPEFKDICKYPRIKLTIYEQEYTLSEKKELELALREKYNPIELHIYTEKHKKNKSDEYKKLGSVTELSTQQELLQKYFEKHKNKEQISRILQLNEKIFNQIPKENLLKNIQWKFKNFKWSNIFSFGDNNEFDFTKYKGIVLINGKNANGKTNFFNSLLYTLFNTTDKTSDIKEIINYNKKECSGEIVIDYNNAQYKIVRKSSKTQKSTSTILDFTKYKEDLGQWISLNGETRPNTDKIIQRTFGSYDDIVISSFAAQGKVSDFLDKGVGNSFLLDLISKFLGVNIYADMYKIANEEYKKIKTIFDSFEKLDYANIIIEYNNEINKLKKTISDITIKKLEIEKSIIDYESLYEIKIKSIQKIPEDISDNNLKESQFLKKIEDKKIFRETIKNTIQSLENRKKIALETLEIVDEKLLLKQKQKEKEISDIEVLINKIETWLREQNVEEIENNISKLNKLSDEQIKLELQISKKEAEMKKDLKQVDILNNQGWNDNEELCKKCELYNNANKIRNKINSIKNEIELLIKEFEANKNEIIFLEHYEQDLSKYKKRELELQQLENKLQLEKSNLSKIETEIKTYLQNKIVAKDKIISDIQLKESELKISDAELLNLINEYKKIQEKNKEYDKYIEIKKQNEEIENELDKIKENILSKKRELNTIQYDILSSEKKISELEMKIQQTNDLLNKIKEYEQLESDYNLYVKAIHREGIPYSIISNSIEIINEEVNKIIEQIEDFRVYFEPDFDKKEININIYHNDGKFNSIQTGSGMEKTITALAIRDALINISSIPRCNIFVMDESIQTFDAEHLSTVGKLFDYLKQRYDCIFVISHLEMIKEYCNFEINVDNKNGFSKLQFLN